MMSHTQQHIFQMIRTLIKKVEQIKYQLFHSQRILKPVLALIEDQIMITGYIQTMFLILIFFGLKQAKMLLIDIIK